MALLDGQALLALLESERRPAALAVALDETRTFLGPLLELGAEEHPRVEALRAIARTHGPIVTRLVKALSSRLNPELRNGPLDAILGEAACLGLDALDCLRPVIKASQHDLATQRYGFLRKMAALGLYEHALAQGRVLHASVVALGVGGLAGPDDLHVAAVANLLLCYSELVQPDAGRAPTLWAEVSGPLDGVLSAARDAVDGSNLSKQLDPVLKCMSKVVEQLKHAAVIEGLGPAATAQQLAAFVMCGSLCRQDQVVQQVLMTDAGSAAEAVQQSLTEALLCHLTEQGTLHDTLRGLLHHTALSLVQKRARPRPPRQPTSSEEHAGATAVRAALQLPHAVLSHPPGEHLRAVLGSLSLCAKAMARADGTLEPEQCWERWCCLDILRSSVSAVLPQLVNTPQSAGGQLLALAQCMELLAHDSIFLLGCRDSPSASVVPAGCSAAAIAVRLLVAHRICTGQLAELHADVSRTIQLLRRVVQQHQLQGCPGGKAVVGASVLQSLSASLGNAGLDLLQAQHTAPAAELLQVAAELALARVRQLAECGAAPAGADVAQLVKKCKAHVTALEQLSEHAPGMAAAASYIAQLHQFAGGNAGSLATLIKLYARANIACSAETVAAAARASAPPPPPSGPSTPTPAASSGPAAPCKAPRRGGRLQRMQAEVQPQEPKAANARTQLSGGQLVGAGPAVSAEPAQPQPQSATVEVSGGASHAARSLVGDLVAAAQLGRVAALELLECLDAYAVQELEVVAEECKRRGEGDAFVRAHTAAVLDALTRCSDANGAAAPVRARTLLVRALVGGADLSGQVDSLQEACDLLDRHLQGDAAPAAGLLDSAALAHAQLGVGLAHTQLAQLACPARQEPMHHIARAVTLWQELLPTVATDGGGPALRMPHATLHAALQALQLLQLRACSHPTPAADSRPVFWRLVRVLSMQVKLREQHVYLLCATMPASTCLGWALAPHPWPCLAEAASRQPQGKVEAVLQLTQPLRDTGAGDALDHRGLAAAADACAAELERSGFLRHGPAPLLLRTQCHQLAAAAHLRAGDTASAHVHAQEALRITCGLYSLLEGSPPTAGRADPGAADAAARQAAAAPVHEPTPAEAAAAAVQSGAATSAQDYAAEEDEEGQDGLVGATPAQQGLTAAPVPPAGARPAPTAGAHAAEAASSRGVSAAFGWAVAAGHLASLHQAARVFEAGGCPEDAACLWNECGRTAEAFGATRVKAMSCCYLAELCCRQGNAEAAQAHLAAAAAAAGEEVAGLGRGSESDSQLLRALLCSARARCALLGSQPAAAEEACSQGLAACAGAGAQPNASPDRDDSAAAAAGTAACNSTGAQWLAASQRAQLARLSAEALLQRGRAPEAAAQLHAALGELRHAATQHGPARSAEAVWPVDCALLLAHEAAAAAAADPVGARGGQCDGEAAYIVGPGPGGGAACSSGARAANGPAPPLDQDADEDLHMDQASKKGSKLGGKGATGKHSRGAVRQVTDQDPQVPAPSPPAAGASTACLAPLLLSLRLCWQLPLAAAHACQQLLRASMALGLPHAAAMFLHLGQGMSYAQQQALHQRLRTRSMRSAPLQSAPRSSRGSAANASSNQARESEGTGVDAASAAAEAGVPWDAREAALQAVCSLCEGAPALQAAAAAAALEGAAAAWLGKALSVLPAECVVVAIAQDAGELLLSRLCVGCPPLLVSLPSERPVTGSDTAGRACDGRGGPGASQAVDGCAGQLRQLLEESGDSMRLDQDGALSQSRKAEWWKLRTSLDDRVRQLLLAMEQQCLGPWRCLLLPVPDRDRRILADTAHAFAREHFPTLASEPEQPAEPQLAAAEGQAGSRSGGRAGGGRLGLLTELLVVVLANMPQLRAADVQVLLGAAGGLASGGAPADAARLGDLAAQLAAAEAAERMQRLCLPRGGQGAEAAGSGAPEATGMEGVQGEAEAGSSVAGRRARGAAGAGPAGGGGGASASARVRPSVARAAVAGVAEAEGASEAPGRSRRAPRLAAMQPEASSHAAADRAPTRGATARAAPRARAAPAAGPPAPQPALPDPVPTPAAPSASAVATAAPCGCAPGGGPVLLALGAALHALPWESMPCLRGQQVYRILSLPLACCAAASTAAPPPAVGAPTPPAASPATAHSCAMETGGQKAAPAAPAARCGPRARNTVPSSAAAVGSSDSSAPAAPAASAPGSPARPSAFYLLNPSGDLADTQRFFQPLLEAQPGWQGLVGERPATRTLLSALQSHDLFLYFGHGSGEQLLPLPALRKLQRCAAALLMGCSSGRLRAHGAYDPAGAAAAYMVAGCPALVANLWDVTDRDIDRYCQALMLAWLGCQQPQGAADAAPAASGRAATAAAGGGGEQEASAQAARSLAVEEAGGDGGSSSGCGVELALAGAVARSRAACKLPYLIGAAPVCYGLPVELWGRGA